MFYCFESPCEFLNVYSVVFFLLEMDILTNSHIQVLNLNDYWLIAKKLA